MKINKQARRDAKSLLRSSMQNGRLDETRVRKIVGAVLSQKPRGYLAILSHYERLVKLEEQRRTGRVESATPLSPEMRANVQKTLEQKYGSGLNIEFTENPALIGGLRIQMGSDVYDGSIQARLNEVVENF
jgi:F-type H+-transporting ATPase subunit delta